MHLYSIADYRQMLADHVRMEAYVAALRKALKPGDVVLDLGSGTGLFAILACRFGARKVYAVEPNDAIHLARQLATANHCADRIEFIQNDSNKVTLAEPADVIVADLRGALPWLEHHLPSLIDARKRLLAPNGVLIPRRDTVMAAVVEAPDVYGRIVEPWDNNPYDLNMKAARRIVTNNWIKTKVKPDQLLTASQILATLDYSQIEDASLDAEVRLEASRSGRGHGLIVWFDAVLYEDIGFSNAPGLPELVYRRAFFPWSEPVELTAGDTVSVRFRASLIGQDYVWCWDSRISESGQANRVKAEYRQSTFFGAPLSPASLAKKSDRHVPRLKEEGKIARFILSEMNGGRTIGEIAKSVQATFPQQFADWRQALTCVAELSGKYSA